MLSYTLIVAIKCDISNKIIGLYDSFINVLKGSFTGTIVSVCMKKP